MISDPQILAPVVDKTGRSTLTWSGWWTQVQAALNSLLNAFTVGSSNAVTITNPAALSFGANFQDYAVSVTPTGGMTVSSSTVNEATFLRVGPLVFVRINLNLSFGGTEATNITISLPVASVGARSSTACSVSVSASGAGWQPCVSFLQGAGISVFAGGNTATNFQTGVATEIDITATYRCA